MEDKMEEKQNEEEGLKCIKVVNTNPDKLTEEGKRNLAMEIIEEISIEDVDKFIGFWGYRK